MDRSKTFSNSQCTGWRRTWCGRSFPESLMFFLIAGRLPGGAPFRTRFCVQFQASAPPATYCHVILATHGRFPAAPFPAACPSALTSSSLRSEEHTSELQSPDHLVCRLLLEKKKNKQNKHTNKNKTQYL